MKVETQVGLPVRYDGIKLDLGCRIDMLINNLVVVELKSVEEISRVHIAQVLSYLKLSKKQLGLIINFNVLRLKDGIKRVGGRQRLEIVLREPSCPLWLKEEMPWQQ